MAVYLYDVFTGYTKLYGEKPMYKTNDKVIVQKVYEGNEYYEGSIARVVNTIYEYFGHIRKERVEVEVLRNGKERTGIFLECFVGGVMKYKHIKWKKAKLTPTKTSSVVTKRQAPSSELLYLKYLNERKKDMFDLSAAKKLVEVTNKERNETKK